MKKECIYKTAESACGRSTCENHMRFITNADCDVCELKETELIMDKSFSLLRRLQVELKPWTLHNFGKRPSWMPLVGALEELGELAHSFLKMSQGIRRNENHEAKIRDAVGDIIVYLADFCNAESIDVHSTLENVWNEVKKRDWKKYPNTGMKETEDKGVLPDCFGIDEAFDGSCPELGCKYLRDCAKMIARLEKKDA